VILLSKAVFLDRDGVINELVYYPELGLIDSPHHIDQFKIINNVPLAIKNLKNIDYKIIIISNQPGIAKNKSTLKNLEMIKLKMKKKLKEKGAAIDGEYYCLHHPYAINIKYKKDCDCRKPNPGLIFRAARDHKIKLERSFMVGDSWTDIKAGKIAGCKTILLGTEKCDLCKLLDEQKICPDFIVKNLLDASKIIDSLS